MDITIRIYGGGVGESLQPPMLEIGNLTEDIHPNLPCLIDEDNVWMIVHGKRQNMYALYSREYLDVAGNPAYVLVCLFLPAMSRLANGKSPLDLLNSLMDVFGLQATEDGRLLGTSIDNTPFKKLLTRYAIEDRPWPLPVMEGERPAAFCVENFTQLEAVMRYSNYQPLSTISCLEIGQNCESTINFSTKGENNQKGNANSSTNNSSAKRKKPSSTTSNSYEGVKKPENGPTDKTNTNTFGTISDPMLHKKKRWPWIGAAGVAVIILIAMIASERGKETPNDPSSEVVQPTQQIDENDLLRVEISNKIQSAEQLFADNQLVKYRNPTQQIQCLNVGWEFLNYADSVNGRLKDDSLAKQIKECRADYVEHVAKYYVIELDNLVGCNKDKETYKDKIEQGEKNLYQVEKFQGIKEVFEFEKLPKIVDDNLARPERAMEEKSRDEWKTAIMDSQI